MNNGQENLPGAPALAAQPVAFIRITLTSDGRLNLEANPIQQKMTLYGMLESARDFIKDYKVESPSIVPVKFGPPTRQ